MAFAQRLITWQRQHGRHHLPWQLTRDPYTVWLSEIMLQQTQVATVIPYFERFVSCFPTLHHLAYAQLDEVLQLWSGLGYYSRARNLHRAAQIVLREFNGVFPSDPIQLVQLPGVGRSTAAAIGAFCFGSKLAILDGNVKRVLARHQGIQGWPGERKIEQAMWALAESLLPDRHIETYTQALMDVGATVCTRSRPLCQQCPLALDCVAKLTNQTARLPTSRPRQVVPEMFLWFIVYLTQDKVWLTRRPISGIWGGLWGFEQHDTLPDPAQCVRELWGHDGVSIRQGALFSHALTHRLLRITPIFVHLQHVIQDAGGGGWWATPQQALAVGIPVPVRRVLQEMHRGID